MYKFLLENLLIIFIGIFLFTQVIWPSFTKSTPYFWIFKRKKKKNPAGKDSAGDNLVGRRRPLGSLGV